LNGEAGEVVVPMGNPLRLTATEPAKPFRLEVEIVKRALELPAAAVTAFCESPIVKSGASVMVKGRFAVWVRSPDVPFIVRA